jgi:ribonuclease HI
LDVELSKHKIAFHWIKAHNGHPENEFVDELARLACEKYKK